MALTITTTADFITFDTGSTLRTYAKKKLHFIDYTLDRVMFYIGSESYGERYEDVTIDAVTPSSLENANNILTSSFAESNGGFSGSFTALDGETVEVENGLITNVVPLT